MVLLLRQLQQVLSPYVQSRNLQQTIQAQAVAGHLAGSAGVYDVPEVCVVAGVIEVSGVARLELPGCGVASRDNIKRAEVVVICLSVCVCVVVSSVDIPTSRYRTLPSRGYRTLPCLRPWLGDASQAGRPGYHVHHHHCGNFLSVGHFS